MKTRSFWRFGTLLRLTAALVLLGGLSGITATADLDQLTVTVLYDNIPFDNSLKTHWGFSCLLEKGSTRILFDTGANSDTLLSNVKALKLDLARLDAVVFSHVHADHTGGYGGLPPRVLTESPVYVPQSFPADLKQQLRAIEVHDTMVLPDGDFRTTGELPDGPLTEQALIVKTRRGLVVLTGCAHPGIVNIVRRVKEISGEKIYLVMGGFHLLQTPSGEVEKITKELRALGVERVSPSHCTGEAAIEMFKREYGTDFVANGVGKVIHVDGGPESD